MVIYVDRVINMPIHYTFNIVTNIFVSLDTFTNMYFYLKLSRHYSCAR